ncbi:MAG TPA: thiol-disulfide oxidoreductase DCC family protein [Chryseolinea sp.]|nr:thiol-disulfide oxidoreductase DCC family protein [Chryseolinea sp.]
MGSLSSPIDTSGKIIVLFDGVCNLCNGAVQFINKRDPLSKFLFASLQSDFGQSQLLKFGLDPTKLHSIIALENGKFYERSDAALRIASGLAQPWPALGMFRILPRFIRDGVYNLIAKNRYKMFGKKESCMIPTPEMKAKFVG